MCVYKRLKKTLLGQSVKGAKLKRTHTRASTQQHHWDTSKTNEGKQQHEQSDRECKAKIVIAKVEQNQMWQMSTTHRSAVCGRLTTATQTTGRAEYAAQRPVVVVIAVLLCIQIIQQLNCAQIMRSNTRGSTTDTRARAGIHTHSHERP